MTTTYSTYEAKARFSEILRKVRAGKRVIVSYHGEEVAEIRPLSKKSSLEERLHSMESSGILSTPAKPQGRLAPVARRPGALQRFLDSRD